LVKDLRQSSRHETTKSLKDLGSVIGTCIDSVSKKKEREVARSGPVHGRPLGLLRPGVLWGIKVGSHPVFRPTQGLGALFNVGERLRR